MKLSRNTANYFYNLADLFTRDIWEELKCHRDLLFNTNSCKPIFVNIDITNRCSLRCQMCNVWQNQKGDELSIRQWVEIIDRLMDWLGSFRLTITGGEPFLKPGIWDFLNYCGNLGIPVVVMTNGYCFTKKNLPHLLDLRITQLVFSLDSLNEDIHDRIRGVEGTFDRIWKAVPYLADKQRHFLIATNTVIMSDNIKEISSFPSVLQGLGVDRVLFQPIQGGFGWDNKYLFKSSLWPKNSNIVDLAFQGLVEAKRKGYPVANSIDELKEFRTYLNQGANWVLPRRCTAGRKMFHCDASGNVRMCIPYPGNIGALQEETPQEIWSGTPAKDQREKILSCRNACLLNCNRIYPLSEKITFAIQCARKSIE